MPLCALSRWTLAKLRLKECLTKITRSVTMELSYAEQPDRAKFMFLFLSMQMTSPTANGARLSKILEMQNT
jgi:hypothetical protein